MIVLVCVAYAIGERRFERETMATEQKMRVYQVAVDGKVLGLIKAKSQAAALDHVLKPKSYTVVIASQDAIVKAYESGMKVEEVTE